MPVPAVIGLAALWSTISTAVVSAISYLVTQTGRKIVIITAIIAGVTIAVNVLLNLLVSTLVPLLNSMPVVMSTLTMALPSNTQLCISAVISVEIACLIYTLSIKALDLQSKVA